MDPRDLWYWVPLPDPVGLALAAVVGLVWMLALAPAAWWRTRVAWLAILAGVILFPPTIAWVQVPIQGSISAWLLATFGQEAIRANLLLAAIPNTLVSGIVQEAAKLLPLLAYVLAVRPRGARRLLQAGAAVGMGFGALEAAWAFGVVFAAGWTPDVVQLAGWQGLIPFIERFFAVGFHTASGVILAYGLIRGIAPAMYALAALLHAAGNYTIAFLQAGLMGIEVVEGLLALWALAVAALALWLRQRALRAEPKRD